MRTPPMEEADAHDAGAGPERDGARGERSREGKKESADRAETGLGRRQPQPKTQQPRGRGLTTSLPVPGALPGAGRGGDWCSSEEGERMKRPARSEPLCVAGLPGAAERERVPEQHPRVPARLRGVPAPRGG